MLMRGAEGHARRAGSTGALMLVFCAVCLVGVLAVVFFPSAKGPFTASYGPATAFRSVKNLQRLELSIATAAQQISTVRLFPVHFYLPVGLGPAAFLKPVHLSKNTLPLLC
jgi:hypothetical protein